ncbi:NRDE-2, necessary for RNA interference-domain-containing protein [Chaetomium strumarium]|uniref:NRDE-2, necessary for RNA interference-domain-containing protein n=1 Tax=Chaetomium strumarium TaxID=1170767 RepID=A0AAJ0LY14_9PEZI|nr:NRDE-2, necessary for RNA interference-domain-containing protein [Chaetomium strumarium]
METEREKEKGKRQRAVPKFGSFKPKGTSQPASPDTRLASGEHRESEKRRGDDRRDDERRRHDHSREHRHSDRERERRRDRDTERDHERDHRRERHRERQGSRPGSPKAASRDERQVTPLALPLSTSNDGDLFIIDKRGDPLILQYGSNDRSQVPAYYRFGAGRIIGSRGFLTIHREGAHERFSIRAPGEGSGSGSAFRDKALVEAAHRSRSRRVKPSADPPPPAAATDDFIPLDTSRKRKRGLEDPTDSDHDDKTPDYRSIYGKARPAASDSDSDSDSDPDVSSSTTPVDPSAAATHDHTELSTAKSRSIALSRHVKAHPTDIPAWLELISLQDTLFRQEHQRGQSQRTPEEVKSLAELKIALYQEALSHTTAAPGPGDRERLLVGMMREGARVWDPAVSARKWDEVAGSLTEGGGKSGCSSFGLWRARLNFEMGRATTVEVGVVKGYIVRKLAALTEELVVMHNPARREQQKEDEEDRDEEDRDEEDRDEEELCEQLVYVFLRLTRLLHDAGFAELAVAAWQAMLEMTFYRPQAGMEYDVESAAAAFADFWESEVPRIGEERAKGWRYFVEAGGNMVDPSEAKGDEPDGMPRTTHPFLAWAAAERQRAEKARMPARTLDEGVEDDPFRVVMFSDVKDFLVWFPSAALPRVRPLLADAFLVFCGLPPAVVSEERFGALLNDDPFVAGRGERLSLGVDQDRRHGETMDLSRKSPEFGQQGGSMAMSPEVLFPGKAWFRYLEEWSSAYRPGDRQVECSWVLGTLKCLVKTSWMEDLAEYYLAMEWLNAPNSVRKTAKWLLKQYSSNTKLYNAYALVEWANQNTEICHNVLSSATGLTSGDGQLLWNTWAWIHLQSGQREMALARLCSSADRDFKDTTVSPALLLKARSYHSSTRDYALSSRQLESASQHAEGLMLIEYLAAKAGTEAASETQGNISAALSSVESFSQELVARKLSGSPHHERLLQAAARLLYYHATHGPYRPLYLRAQLQTFIRLFPRNAIFLSLFAWSHSSSLRLADDPVRNVLSTLSLAEPHDCLSTRRFAIQYEARAGIGTAHSVRAAFESALTDSDAACLGSSVELWTAYLHFCCSHGELRGKKAREVFYRAIAACPWSKEVYMEAFTLQEGLGLDDAELRAVYETMVAKGLRVHVDLEESLGEFLQGRGRGR